MFEINAYSGSCNHLKLKNISVRKIEKNTKSIISEKSQEMKPLKWNDSATFTEVEKIDLFIDIYKMQDNYSELIKVLNIGIRKCSEKKLVYRQVKKDVIFKKIMEDLRNV